MTRNQLSVLRWLRSYCDAASIIRVSNSEIAEVFGWSQPYAKRILSKLVASGYLEVLQPGAGHRATRYLVTSASHNPFTTSHNQVQVTKDSLQETKPFRYTKTHNNTQGDIAQTIAHVQNIFDNVAIRVRKPLRSGATPFKKFRQHCDKVEEWKSTDFVCYFSLVYKVRFGETPKLEWSKDVGAAKTLLRRVGDPLALKSFIQIAFSVCKRPPNGLYSFSYGSFYEEVIDREISEAILDEYDDEYVFPWLFIERKKTATLVQDEYDRKMLKVYLGL